MGYATTEALKQVKDGLDVVSSEMNVVLLERIYNHNFTKVTFKIFTR